MSRFNFEIPQELTRKLKELENIEPVMEKMIDEATPILVDSIQARLASHKDTGALLKSVKKVKAKRTKSGSYYGAVVFRGNVIRNGHKTSNMLKAIVMEYGSESQVARPFMKAAINDCRQEVNRKMQETFEREVGL